MQGSAQQFLTKYKEKADLNQYWYSQKTIEFLADQTSLSKHCCFLSTPSIFYAFAKMNPTHSHYLFDFDPSFAKNNPNFYLYDFNHPQSIPNNFYHYFDFIVVDPPFITHEVWAKYCEAIKLLGNQDCKILASTIDENESFLNKQLGLKRQKWRPSIPHLVYQYSLFSNYYHVELEKMNPQIGE